MTTVKIINKSHHALPTYETLGAAGMDIRAWLQEPVTLQSLERKLISTGLFIELPDGFEAQLRPRSGMAFKHGITLPNSPATIDADYRGEIKIALVNISNQAFTIHDGDRIAQMVIARYEKIEWRVVEALSESNRGEGGFGSTGKQ
jgi:dUTP pyrophosphatase